jgi:hypothetical protein
MRYIPSYSTTKTKMYVEVGWNILNWIHLALYSDGMPELREHFLSS